MTTQERILTPQGLWVDFRQGARTGRDLPPYREIAPGMVVGHEPGKGAVCATRHDDAGRRIIIDVETVGTSRWLTFEYELDHRMLLDTGLAMWAATMSSTPRTAYRLDLRMWLGDDGTFADFVVGHGVTHAVERRLREMFLVEGIPQETIERCTGTRFIQVLPLSPASFSVASILSFPWSRQG